MGRHNLGAFWNFYRLGTVLAETAKLAACLLRAMTGERVAQEGTTARHPQETKCTRRGQQSARIQLCLKEERTSFPLSWSQYSASNHSLAETGTYRPGTTPLTL